MDLISSLCVIAKTANTNFTFCGKSISYEEVFADVGLLPSMAQRADRLCSLCLGYGIGATFTEAEKALLGVRVQFDDITPDILRLIYIYDVVLEIIKAAPTPDQIPLDELMYD
ncbi:MAG: type IV secretion IcmS family protein [bacterium]